MANDKNAPTPATPKAPAIETVTPDGVLGKLREAMASADPFSADPRIAKLRQAGVGLSEAIHRVNSARAHVTTLEGVVADLATKALVTISEALNPSAVSSTEPKKRGRPPGSKNTPKDASDVPSNGAATSDSPAGLAD